MREKERNRQKGWEEVGEIVGRSSSKASGWFRPCEEEGK